ncbi:SGNH/GDSL hydrolase family protein [Pedococcus sp. NPDC057267]|uniref:SGNH/GDSL hydrolase family protein n=1 Tax=Pedococcus sp. NPDC057267 TaxID=3346077 RepID=UPI00362E6AB9
MLGVVLAMVLAGCMGGAYGTASPTRPPGATAPTTTTAPTGSASPSPTTTGAAPLPTLRLVGLGDSVMSGAACACQPFLAQYASMLATRDHRAVSPSNLGESGLTAAQLVDQLSEPGVAAEVASAGTVVVTIGANDLLPLVSTWSDGGCDTSCVQPAVAQMRQAVAQVLSRIHSLVPDSTQVLVTDYWNVFEDGDVADSKEGPGFAGWSDGVTVAANAAICTEAQSAGDVCVDLYHPFLGADGTNNPTSLLAEDGDHPDAAGHTLIAKALLSETPQPAS